MSMQHHNHPPHQHNSPNGFVSCMYHYTLPQPSHHQNDLLLLEEVQWLLYIKQTQQHLHFCLQRQSQHLSSLIQHLFPIQQYPELYHPNGTYVCGISCAMSLTQRSVQYVFFIRHRRTQRNIMQHTIVTHSSLADLYDQWFFQNTKCDIEEQLRQLKPHILSYFQTTSIWQRIWHFMRRI